MTEPASTPAMQTCQRWTRSKGGGRTCQDDLSSSPSTLTLVPDPTRNHHRRRTCYSPKALLHMRTRRSVMAGCRLRKTSQQRLARGAIAQTSHTIRSRTASTPQLLRRTAYCPHN
eukprot:174337-Prymnesium_polylepis.1